MTSTQTEVQVRPILLVEDNPNDEALALRALKKANITSGVTVVRDGAEALDKISTSPPDLVVLDVKMPGISGIEVCRRLREHSDVPVIMLTARGEEADRVLGLDMVPVTVRYELDGKDGTLQIEDAYWAGIGPVPMDE